MFLASAAHQLCELSHVHTLITGDHIDEAQTKMIEQHGVKLVAVKF